VLIDHKKEPSNIGIFMEATMDKQLIVGRIAVCMFGGMLALVTLSMTPALAQSLNPQPLPPEGTTGGHGKHVMVVHHGHITYSGSHIKGITFGPHLAPQHISH